MEQYSTMKKAIDKLYDYRWKDITGPDMKKDSTYTVRVATGLEEPKETEVALSITDKKSVFTYSLPLLSNLPKIVDDRNLERNSPDYLPDYLVDSQGVPLNKTIKLQGHTRTRWDFHVGKYSDLLCSFINEVGTNSEQLVAIHDKQDDRITVINYVGYYNTFSYRDYRYIMLYFDDKQDVLGTLCISGYNNDCYYVPVVIHNPYQCLLYIDDDTLADAVDGNIFAGEYEIWEKDKTKPESWLFYALSKYINRSYRESLSMAENLFSESGQYLDIDTLSHRHDINDFLDTVSMTIDWDKREWASKDEVAIYPEHKLVGNGDYHRQPFTFDVLRLRV